MKPFLPPPPQKKRTGNGRNVSKHTKKQDVYKKNGFQICRKTVLSLSLKGPYMSQLITIFKCKSLRCGLDEALSKLNTVLISV